MEETPQTNTKSIKKSKVITFIIIVLSSFILEILFRDMVSNFSVSIQKSLTTVRDDICNNFNNFAHFVEIDGVYLVTIIILNLGNTFSAFSYLMMLSFGIYLNGILKLFYLDPRPYWVDTELKPCVCIVNYGNPSTSSLVQFVVYSLVYKVFTSVRKYNKYIMATLCIIPAVLICGMRFVQNAHSLNQILFGFSIGFMLYYLYFEVLEVDLNCQKQFRFIVKNTPAITIIVIALITFAFIFHWSLNLGFNTEWLDTITKYCKYAEFDYFDNESYQKTCRLLMFTAGLLGYYYDYQTHFKGDLKEFSHYHMDSEKSFANTSVKISFMRISAMIALYFCFKLSIDFVLSLIVTTTFTSYIIINHCVSVFCYGIFTLHFVIVITRAFGLTNETFNGIHQSLALATDHKEKLLSKV